MTLNFHMLKHTYFVGFFVCLSTVSAEKHLIQQLRHAISHEYEYHFQCVEIQGRLKCDAIIIIITLFIPEHHV